MKEEKKAVALRMLKSGQFLPELIAELSELPLEEVLKLKAR